MNEEYVNKVICGDCIAALQGIPDQCFDVVVTDPPYNVGLNYDVHSDSMPDYKQWCFEWFAELRRVCKGAICISIGQANIGLWASIKEPDWWLCWHKPAAMGRCLVGFNNWEPIAIYGKCRHAENDVIVSVIKPDKTMQFHPCPKPVDWAAKQIRMFCPTDGLVLDPFGGSGTVAVAAIELNKRYFLIEKSEDYVSKMVQRIKQAELQQHLFHDGAKTVEQCSLPNFAQQAKA